MRRELRYAACLLLLAGGALAGEPPKILELSAELAARVRAYPGLFASGSRSDAGLCLALEEAGKLARDLELALSDRRDALFDSPAYDAFLEALAALNAELPGMHHENLGETAFAYVEYDRFAGLRDAARPLLQAAHAFLGHAEPAWARLASSHVTACADLGRAAEPLARIAECWEKAPACVKAALGPRLAEELKRMLSWKCHCQDRPGAERALKALSPALGRLAPIVGAGAAEKALAGLSDPETRFECKPEPVD
ncbi:MAG: hypothetical protein JXR96_30925 [Deltaproteobacteria bacterium]|nr:hypothetical protein [Deltaproteobacteria bacterium]